jgi:coproporphyrinogen III oxidase
VLHSAGHRIAISNAASCPGQGIGGLFFDDLPASNAAFPAEAFVRAVARGVVPSWDRIAQRRRGGTPTPEQRQWQLLRRGRYLEFNLLYDRGVKFGLDGVGVHAAAAAAALAAPPA